MNQHSITVSTASEHDDLGKKVYESPILEILDSDSTEANAGGAADDGAIVTATVS